MKRRYEIISRRVINNIYLEILHSYNLASSFLEKRNDHMSKVNHNELNALQRSLNNYKD